MDIVPLILCGGEGSRLWPLTNDATPKHMLKLPNGNSLFEETLKRAVGLSELSTNDPQIITTTNQQFEQEIVKRCKSISLKGLQCEFLLEPVVRDTAAPIALGALSLVDANRGEAVLTVLPADHKIGNQKAFQKTLLEAVEYAANGKLVSIGVMPSFASSAFGYLEVSDGVISKFTEKPSLKTAKDFVAGGKHFWNSGIFCCKANVLIALLQTHCPEFLKQCKNAFQNALTETEKTCSTTRFEKSNFSKIENKSIDYQLLNLLSGTRCVEAKFQWSDVGSWDSYCDLFGKDDQGNSNATMGFSESSSNCSAFTSVKPIAMLGLKDVVVVNTDQAILVADKNYAQNVKHLVKKMPKQATKEPTNEVNTAPNIYDENTRIDEVRPWGRFETLMEREGYKVKRLIVDPFQSLSLQSHQHRREHWLVVEGSAVATLNDEKFILNKNDHIDIPVQEKHRISNPNHHRLVIIETQTGNYLEEDDEVRHEDIYGRADKCSEGEQV